MKLPSWRRSIWGWVCVGLIGVVGLILSVVIYWEWFATHPCGMESRSTTLRNLVLGFGGIIAIGLAAWRGIVADRQAKASRDQAETSRATLLHDRYQRGAEMLGHQLPSVRWSGILSLQHLAQDEWEEYCIPVITLLAIFVSSPHTPDMTVEADRGDVEFAKVVIDTLKRRRSR